MLQAPMIRLAYCRTKVYRLSAMDILWILPGLGMAAAQFLLSFLMVRLHGTPAKILLLLGKLLLWVLFFVLLVNIGVSALLFGGIAAMTAYTLLAALWMLRHIKKEKEHG